MKCSKSLFYTALLSAAVFANTGAFGATISQSFSGDSCRTQSSTYGTSDGGTGRAAFYGVSQQACNGNGDFYFDASLGTLKSIEIEYSLNFLAMDLTFL